MARNRPSIGTTLSALNDIRALPFTYATRPDYHRMYRPNESGSMDQIIERVVGIMAEDEDGSRRLEEWLNDERKEYGPRRFSYIDESFPIEPYERQVPVSELASHLMRIHLESQQSETPSDYRVLIEDILEQKIRPEVVELGPRYTLWKVLREIQSGKTNPWNELFSAANRFTQTPELFQRGSRYIAVGDYPLAEDVSTDYSLYAEFLDAQRRNCLRYRGQIEFILIGNAAFEFNVMFNQGIYNAVSVYRQEAGNILQGPSLDYEDIQKEAELVGRRDQMMVQASQKSVMSDEKFLRAAQFLDEREWSDFGDYYKPVVLMSNLVEQHPEIKELFGQLADLAKEDKDLLRMLWKCVPAARRAQVFEVVNNHFEKFTDEDLKSECGWTPEEVAERKKLFSPKRASRVDKRRFNQLTPVELEWVLENSGYALMQTAFVLYWGGVKNGHSQGEGNFDDIVKHCLDHHREAIQEFLPEDDVKFNYLDEEASVNRSDFIRELDFHGLSEESVFYGGGMRGQKSRAELLSLNEPEVENIDELIEKIESRLSRFLPHFLAFLQNIDRDTYLSEEQRQKLLYVEYFKIIRAMGDSLSRWPVFASVISDSGLRAVFEGESDISQLAESNQLPFNVDAIPANVIQAANQGRYLRREHDKRFSDSARSNISEQANFEGPVYLQEIKGINRYSAKRWLECQGIAICEANQELIELMEMVERMNHDELFEKFGYTDFTAKIKAEHPRLDCSNPDDYMRLEDLILDEFSRLSQEAEGEPRLPDLESEFERYFYARFRLGQRFEVGRATEDREQRTKWFLGNVHCGEIAESLYRFSPNETDEPAPIYLIRHMMKALSNPVSQHPKLAQLLNGFFQQLFQVIYPDFELRIDMNESQWEQAA